MKWACCRTNIPANPSIMPIRDIAELIGLLLQPLQAQIRRKDQREDKKLIIPFPVHFPGEFDPVLEFFYWHG